MLPNTGVKHGSHLTTGALQVFIGHAVSLPTGLVTSAFLTRQLGPEDYGTFTVATSVIVIIELIICQGSSQSVQKFVAARSDWQPVATRFLRFQLLLGLAAMLVLIATSPLLAAVLNSPALSFYLMIYAVSVPVGAMRNIHLSILVGRGRYRARAILQGAYWLIRLVLIVVLVSFHTSITAVIICNIASAALVLGIARLLVSPPLFQKSSFSGKLLLQYAWPLLWHSVCIRLLVDIDLFFVKALQHQPEAAGYYGATKNLTIIPVLVAASLAPLLLSKTSGLLAVNQREAAGLMIRNAFRFIICLIPFAVMTVGISSRVMALIFGSRFSAAGPLLAVLIFASLANCLRTVAAAALISAGKPQLTVNLILPFVAVAIAALSWSVPAYGPFAAAVTAVAIAAGSALTFLLAVFFYWRVFPAFGTFVRTVAISVLIYLPAYYVPLTGVRLAGLILVMGIAIAVLYIALGELNRSERQFLLRLFPGAEIR